MKLRPIGSAPVRISSFKFDLPEVMYYLYLPVVMGREWRRIEMPHNIHCLYSMVVSARNFANEHYNWDPKYAYISARKGWATKDNPLNRPGWHIDGYGSSDLNFVWWAGDGTRFAIQEFKDVSPDHTRSLEQFEEQVDLSKVETPEAKTLYLIDQSVVHATPDIVTPHMRQYVKISFSEHEYALENNSHNYAFQYNWKMQGREEIRNDPYKAQKDSNV